MMQAQMGSTPNPLSGRLQDWLAAVIVGLGLLGVYGPTYHTVAQTLWVRDDHAHGPLILLIVAVLVWLKRDRLRMIPMVPDILWGTICLGIGLIIYVIGRSQDIYLFDLGSQIPVISGLILLFFGRQMLGQLWFPILFLIFLLPLPGPLVTALTGPLQKAISAIVETILYAFNYPIARSGVILQIGYYQLFVANACSGLNSMFSLTAIGCLYLYLVQPYPVLRNVLLGVMILPLAFSANIVRVLVLVLTTYHFGDSVAQGTFHGFSGMILFFIALVLLLLWDGVLGLLFGSRNQHV